MDNKDFLNSYLTPFVKAIDENILDVRYIHRIAPYELANITYKSGKFKSFDITGKTRREISRMIIDYILTNGEETA